MINNNTYNTPDRIPKIIAANSPQPRRKNMDYVNNTPITNASTNDYSRKEPNPMPLSPHPHFYPQKLLNGKSIQLPLDKEYNLEGMFRELSEKFVKMSQKVAQHETILIKMTENSIESNKEQYKRSSGQVKPDIAKITENISQNVSKLRKDFEDYRSGNILTKEIEVKNQLFSQLIHKSQDRMRQEMQSMVRKLSEISPKTSCSSSCSDQRLEELDRVVKKHEKNIMLNTNKIFGAYQKIESISSSIDGHMDLINAEVNKAISKIVSFVNDKIGKPTNESIAKLTEKMEKLEAVRVESHFGNFRSTTKRSEKNATKAEYQEILTIHDQEIIIREKVYYIDIDGYLLDQDYFYLVDKNDEKIRLDEKQIQMLNVQNLLT